MFFIPFHVIILSLNQFTTGAHHGMNEFNQLELTRVDSITVMYKYNLFNQNARTREWTQNHCHAQFDVHLLFASNCAGRIFTAGRIGLLVHLNVAHVNDISSSVQLRRVLNTRRVATYDFPAHILHAHCHNSIGSNPNMQRAVVFHLVVYQQDGII